MNGHEGHAIAAVAGPEAPVAPSRDLAAKLAALRRKRAAVCAGAGTAGLVAAATALLAAGMLLDWIADLPRALRALLLAADLGLLGLVAWLRLLAPLLRGPDEDESALLVERSHPEFRTRLIASIQLTRPGALAAGTSAAFVRALVAETEHMAGAVDFSRLVTLGRLLRAAGVAVALLAAGLAAFVSGGDSAADLLRRALLARIPVPRQTRVECLTGNRIVAVGDPVDLEARAHGHIPASGRVRVAYDSGRAQEFSIEPAPGYPARFLRRLDNVQDSFRYLIYLHDGRSGEWVIRAVPRPAVASLECQQIYPAYTQESPVRRAPGDLLLLAGSRLRVKVTANKDIRGGAFHLTGLGTTIPLTVDERSRRRLDGEIPIPAAKLTGFSVHLKDLDGLESRDPAVYRIDILPDRPPSVRITYPDRREELVTAQARMLVGFEASDDYAIGRVRLRYRTDRAEGDAGDKAIELDLGGEAPKSIRRRFAWSLAALRPPPSEGGTIEYWLEVLDNNDVTGPGLSATDHFQAKVVDESTKRADLMNRLSDYLTTLTDVARDQEQLSENLGAIILEKPPAPPPQEGDAR